MDSLLKDIKHIDLIVSNREELDNVILNIGKTKTPKESEPKKFIKKLFGIDFTDIYHSETFSDEEKSDLENFLNEITLDFNFNHNLHDLPVMEIEESIYSTIKNNRDEENFTQFVYCSLNYDEITFKEFSVKIFEEYFTTKSKTLHSKIISSLDSKLMQSNEITQKNIFQNFIQKLQQSQEFLSQCTTIDYTEVIEFLPKILQQTFIINDIRKSCALALLKFTSELLEQVKLKYTPIFPELLPSVNTQIPKDISPVQNQEEYNRSIFRSKEAEEWFYFALEELSAICFS